MFVTTLLVIIGTLISDAGLSCRAVATPAGYDFARVRLGECVTLATADDAPMAYIITEIRVTQVLGGDDGYGSFAFDALDTDTEAGVFLYKLLERHQLAPPQSRGIPLQAV